MINYDESTLTPNIVILLQMSSQRCSKITQRVLQTKPLVKKKNLKCEIAWHRSCPLDWTGSLSSHSHNPERWGREDENMVLASTTLAILPAVHCCWTTITQYIELYYSLGGNTRDSNTLNMRWIQQEMFTQEINP